MDNVRCSDCGTELVDEEGTHSKCKICGSTKRTFYVSIINSVTVNAYQKIKHEGYNLKRREGRHRAAQETTIGDDYQRKSGKWLKIYRIVDRIHDLYIETLSDPKTGEIVRDFKERLSAHTNHGTAKKKE